MIVLLLILLLASPALVYGQLGPHELSSGNPPPIGTATNTPTLTTTLPPSSTPTITRTPTVTPTNTPLLAQDGAYDFVADGQDWVVPIQNNKGSVRGRNKTITVHGELGAGIEVTLPRNIAKRINGGMDAGTIGPLEWRVLGRSRGIEIAVIVSSRLGPRSFSLPVSSLGGPIEVTRWGGLTNGDAQIAPVRIVDPATGEVLAGPIPWAYSDVTGEATVVLPDDAAFPLPYVIDPTIVTTWADTAYQRRVRVDIDGGACGAGCVPASDLSNFPLTMKIECGVDATCTNIQADCDDVIVYDEDQSTQLKHELEYCTKTTNEEIILHAKKPTIDVSPYASGSDEPHVWLYLENGSATSTEDAANVWDGNFVTVWHLSEDPSGGAPQMQDSTSSNLDLNAVSMESGDQTAAIIDGGVVLDSVEYMTRGQDDAALSALNPLTVTAWGYRTNDNQAPPHSTGVLAAKDCTGGCSGIRREWQLSVVDSDQANANKLGWVLYNNGTSAGVKIEYSTGTVSNNAWHHFAGVYTGSQMPLYLDGVDVSDGDVAFSGTISDTNSHVTVGINGDLFNHFIGTVDEVRISNVARSAVWIKAEYDSARKDCGTNEDCFLTFNTEEVGTPTPTSTPTNTPTGATPTNTPTSTPTDTPTSTPTIVLTWADTNYQRRVRVDIDGGACGAGCVPASDLTNFPLTMRIECGVDVTCTNIQADCDDVIVYDEDQITQLKHELEFCTKTTNQEIVLHVKKPTIDVLPYAGGSNEPHVWLYLENGSATSTEDAANVWDANYVAVFHMSEDPSTTNCNTQEVCDSTSGSNDADTIGTWTSGDSITGKIGNGLNFDGGSGATGDALQILNESPFDFEYNQEFTYSFWLKTTQASSTYSVVLYGKMQTFGDGTGIYNLVTSGKPRLDIHNDYSPNIAAQEITSSATINDGNWRHLVQQNTSPGGTCASIKHFIDGAEVTSVTCIADSLAGNTVLNNQNVYIGNRALRGNSDCTSACCECYYVGDMDEFRISNTARSAVWLKAEYDSARKNCGGGSTDDCFLTFNTEEVGTPTPTPTSTPIGTPTSTPRNTLAPQSCEIPQ